MWTALGHPHSYQTQRQSPHKGTYVLSTPGYPSLNLFQLQPSYQSDFRVESPKTRMFVSTFTCPSRAPFAQRSQRLHKTIPTSTTAVLPVHSMNRKPKDHPTHNLPWLQPRCSGYPLSRKSWKTPVYIHLSFSHSTKESSLHRSPGIPNPCHLLQVQLSCQGTLCT